MIEYSHRAVVGIVSIVMLAAAVLVFLSGKRLDAKLYTIGIIVFVVLQAYLGARAALYPEQKLVLALHFGISLLAFAFSLLLYITCTKWGQFGEIERGLRSSVSKPFRMLAAATLAYSYVVVYLGAYVRHSVSSGGCSGWPLCNGQVVPELSGATGIVFTHRLAALLLFMLVLWLYLTARVQYRSSSYIYKSTQYALILVVLQVISGATVTWTVSSDLYLFTALVHAVLVAFLFASLCYLCVLLFSTERRSSHELR